MIILKAEVSINGVKPEIVYAMERAGDIWDKFNKDLVVTSVCDGEHNTNSLHYVGYACDLRTNSLSESQLKRAVDMLRNCLGKQYDIVLDSDHCHLEFQPEKGINL